MSKLCDHLSLFNTGLVNKITAMNDEELWDFLLANEDHLKELQYPNGSPASGFIYGYAHGIDNFRRCFSDAVEEYREGLIFTMVLDFCFKDKKIRLDPSGMNGFLDHSDSCDVEISETFMPPVEEDSEAAVEKEYFHLLEPHHVGHIIKALEENFENLETDTREDIEKIKEMREFCLNNREYKVAYIFNV